MCHGHHVLPLSFCLYISIDLRKFLPVFVLSEKNFDHLPHVAGSVPLVAVFSGRASLLQFEGYVGDYGDVSPQWVIISNDQ